LQRQAAADVFAHGFFAAEEMRAAGNVEHHAVGRAQAHERRVAAEPVVDRFAEILIGDFVGVVDEDGRIHRARVG